MAPQNLLVNISSSTSIYMSWQPPLNGHINGIIRHFHVMIVLVADSAVIHDDIVDHNSLETQIDNLQPSYQYQCSVTAVTTDEGPAANVSIIMPSDGESYFNHRIHVYLNIDIFEKKCRCTSIKKV